MSTMQAVGSIVTDGLVLHLDAANYKSYPGSGTTWTDLTINSYNNTLTNGPTFSSNNAGIIGFDGANNYSIVTNANIKNYTTITANIWMYITSTNAWETYFSYNAEESGLSQGWGLRRQSTNSIFQYWGGTGNTGIKLYKNGALLSTSAASSATISTTTNDNWQMITVVATGVSSWNTHNRLTIATRSDTINSTTNMKTSLFMLFNRELSATEVLQNYNAVKRRFGIL